MSAATVIAPGGGEVVGDAPDRRVEILSDDASLNATWSRFAPGRDGADLHVHREHADHFFVLDGELTVRLGTDGACVAVAAGTLARIPPLVVHGFRNASDADVRFLNLHAPGRGFADYMRGLRDGRPLAYDQHPPPPDGGRPPADAVFTGDSSAGDATVLADLEEIAVVTLLVSSSSAPETHVHPRRVESLYVLEGELALTLGARELRASTGTWVQIPPGVPRCLSSSGRARVLDIHTPG